MPGTLIHTKQLLTCPHGGQVQTITTDIRVKMNGIPVALANDVSTIAGCAFTIPPGKPQPCVKVLWGTPALRVKVMGQPVLLSTSLPVLCQSAEQIPQGPPMQAPPQVRVKGI